MSSVEPLMRPLDAPQLRAVAASGLRTAARQPLPHGVEPAAHGSRALAQGIVEHALAEATLPEPIRDRAMARRALVEALAKRLHQHLGQLLLSELEVFRVSRGSFWDRLAALSDTTVAGDTVRRYCAWLADGGLDELLAHLPLLERLLLDTVEGWWANSRQFFATLARDADTLTNFLGAPEGVTPPVTNLLFDMGDLHHGGRTVSGVRFESYGAAVFKPRSPLPDLLWEAVVGWVNERAEEPWLRAPRVLPRDGYLWVEYVESQPCHYESEIVDYYERAGALLCLCHVMNLGDTHHENLIAAGPYPVVVDLETLLAVQRPPDSRTATRAALSWSGQSLLRLGILPNWQPLGGEGWRDSASLGSGSAPGEVIRHFVDGNLAASERRTPLAMGQNVPLLKGERQGADGYVDDLCRGFERMRRLLVTHRASLIALVDSFATRPTFDARLVLRATLHYGMALTRASERDALQSAATRKELLTPPLIKGLVHDGYTKEAARIQQAERAQLVEGDIPLFRVPPASTRLLSPALGEGIDLPHFEPGLMAFRRRLSELESDATENYRRTIRWSFEGRVSVSHEKKRSLAPEWPATEPATDAMLLDEAERLGAVLVEQAIWGEDGSATWLMPSFTDDGRGYGVRPMDSTIYAGRGGVSIFLSSLATVTGNATFAALAIAAISESLESLSIQIRSGQVSCGAISGYGSLIFAGAELAHHLQRPEMHGTILEAVLESDIPNHLGPDAALDVMNGRAGLLLALTTLWHRTQQPALLALIDQLAEGLRASSVGEPGRYLFDEGRKMTGFSHGNAGIAHALFAAHAVTGTPAHRDAAIAATAFENRSFDSHSGNWQDLRTGGAEAGMVAWCNGASGIGLARLPWLDLHPDGRADVEAALQATRRYPPGGTQHLCCGDAGRLGFLAQAGHRLDHDDLRQEARRRAAWLIERARQHDNRYVLVFGQTTGSEANPSLFRGIAGLGLLYLRMVAPQSAIDPLTVLPSGWR